MDPSLLPLIAGSFRSLSLFLLAFDPLNRTIHHVQTIPAFGPHQYIATNPHKDRVYTTSWALPPTLSSWVVERNAYDDTTNADARSWRVSHLNTVPITATSSYIDLPRPWTHIYSTGGPTGEIHLVDTQTGAFGEKTQEFLFVPEDQLLHADKTRVGLRYGSHGIESTSTPSYSLTFVPVLGTNTIEVYNRDLQSGLLTHLASSPSPRGPDAHDGPRHVKVHPNGKILYCVTEHSNFVDLYEISPPSPSSSSSTSILKYISSRSLLPLHLRSPLLTLTRNSTQPHPQTTFRGDTLLLHPPTPQHPSPRALFTTTRGSESATRGWITVSALDEDGYFVNDDNDHEEPQGVLRYEAPTSGGKAHAIDVLPKARIPLSPGSPPTPFSSFDDGVARGQAAYVPPLDGQAQAQDQDQDQKREEEGTYVILTDDDDAVAESGVGGIKILEWDGWGEGGLRLVAQWPSPTSGLGKEGDRMGEEKEEDIMRGASHAIWLV